MSQDTLITLSDGRCIALRSPTAGDLRGVKLLDVLQMDTAALAPVVERTSELSAAEFFRLQGPDLMAIASGVVSFFAPTAAPSNSGTVSKTPGP